MGQILISAMFLLLSSPIQAGGLTGGPTKSKYLPQHVADKGWTIGLISAYKCRIDKGRITTAQGIRLLNNNLKDYKLTHLRNWINSQNAQRAISITSQTLGSNCKLKPGSQNKAYFKKVLPLLGYKR